MDSDEDLPPAFDYSNSADKNYKKDDIVIIQWRRVTWPAVVVSIMPRKKKVNVMVIDGPYNRNWLTLPLLRVSKLGGNIDSLITQHRNGKNFNKFKSAMDKAQDFLFKKGDGSVKSADEYFKLDKDMAVDALDCSVDSAVLSDISMTTSVDDRPLSRSSFTSDDSGKEDNLLDTPKVMKSRERRKRQNDKILNHILDGKVDDHLIGIYKAEKQSHRHKMFFSSLASERNKLKRACSFGPIDDEDQQENLITYLHNLMKKESSNNETFNDVAYVFEVWIPEAIIKSVQAVRRMNEAAAENVLKRGPMWTNLEKKMNVKEWDNVKLTEEERASHRERMEALLEARNIPLQL